MPAEGELDEAEDRLTMDERQKGERGAGNREITRLQSRPIWNRTCMTNR
jgi:hypothetical protein